jgi:type II secretory pathway pseudopilin PulG
MVWLIANLLIGVGVVVLGVWATVPFAPPANVRDAVATQTSLRVIARHLEAFHDAHGRYPSTEEGLVALAAGSKNLRIGNPSETDSWGTGWVYRLPGERSGKTFQVYSAGFNRVDDSGKGDDLAIATPLTHSAYRPGFSLERKVLALGAGCVILGVLLRLVYRD